MSKKSKIIVLLTLLLLVIILIMIVHFMRISTRRHISDSVIKYMEDSINLDNENITKEYIDRNISKVNKETATKMVTLYQNYQDSQKEKIYTQIKELLLESGEIYSIDELNNLEVSNEKLKLLLEEVRNNGYKLKEVWADIEIVIDYSKYQDYEKYVTDDMKKYLEIQNEYEKELYEYEGTEGLLLAIINMENEINGINNKEIKNEAIDIYMNTLVLLMKGNIPYVNMDNSNERKINILNTININPNTITASILDKYIKALENDGDFGENCESLVEELEKNIYSYFK